MTGPDERSRWSVDGVLPAAIVRPASREEIASVLAGAAARRQRVLPAGEGTRLDRGSPPEPIDLLVLTRGLDRIVAYEPADLTVTVEAGLPLAALDAALAGRGQFLPLQPYRKRGTVGGLLATADEGALALGCGRPRDLLIGARAALADGTIVRGRGAVVKNVAGYDLPRLMAGSLGTLGVIVEASFKLLPRPGMEGTVLFELPSLEAGFEAARRILEARMEPVFVDLLSGAGRPRLAVGFDGSPARVRSLMAAASDAAAPARPDGRTILSEEANAILRGMLDDPATAPFAGGRAPVGPAIVKLLCLPTRLRRAVALIEETAGALGAAARACARPGLGVALVAIAGADEFRTREAAGAVLSALRAPPGPGVSPDGPAGPAVLLSAPAGVKAGLDVWGPPPPDFPLMRRIRDALDPDGLFACGRYVGGL